MLVNQPLFKLLLYTQHEVIAMTSFEYSECLRETLQDLREDAMLLVLALNGVRSSVDSLTLDCLLRLNDYLNQHMDDLRFLCSS